MRLTSLLDPRSIAVPLRAPDRDGAIAELLDAIVRSGHLEPSLRESALRAVLARERSLSTGMEHGVALPHGAVDGLAAPVCAMGVHPSGVPFSSLDGSPARLIVLMLLPRNHNGQIATLAGIARLLNDAPLRGRLHAASTASEILSTLGTGEATEEALS
ncbi:MAG: PTS sugar transporter subunit IIA [Planctomycetes bacterium]|nr:PTS sugar transporter subunit IIA [Planctomycetota bacterium]